MQTIPFQLKGCMEGMRPSNVNPRVGTLITKVCSTEQDPGYLRVAMVNISQASTLDDAMMPPSTQAKRTGCVLHIVEDKEGLRRGRWRVCHDSARRVDRHLTRQVAVPVIAR